MARLCAARKLALFYVRPKCHLFGHILKLTFSKQDFISFWAQVGPGEGKIFQARNRPGFMGFGSFGGFKGFRGLWCNGLYRVRS